MKKAILALVIGAALGYGAGYVDARAGKATVVSRTLDKFGISKVRDAQSAREARVQAVIKP